MQADGATGGQTYLVAGNTDTKLRQELLAQGKQVYTAPVMDDWGPVREPSSGPGPLPIARWCCRSR